MPAPGCLPAPGCRYYYRGWWTVSRHLAVCEPQSVFRHLAVSQRHVPRSLANGERGGRWAKAEEPGCPFISEVLLLLLLLLLVLVLLVLLLVLLVLLLLLFFVMFYVSLNPRPLFVRGDLRVRGISQRPPAMH